MLRFRHTEIEATDNHTDNNNYDCNESRKSRLLKSPYCASNYLQHVRFILLAETTDFGGEESEYPEKTPGDEFYKMQHNKARKFKLQPRLEPAL